MDNSVLKSDLQDADSTTTSHDAREVLDLANNLSYDWYIRVKVLIQGSKASDMAAQVANTGIKVTSLHETLQRSLNLFETQFLPQRYMDASEKGTEESRTCYWLIGLPTMRSDEIAEARKIVRAWEAAEERVERKKVVAKFVKRDAILQQDLMPDTALGDQLASEVTTPKEPIRKTGESFRKIRGSNPAQIRTQFLQHAMGAEMSEDRCEKNERAGGRLRPPKDVLNKLKYDERYQVDDYVVGFIDRQAGIWEKSIAEWQEYEEQELIAYFRFVPKDEIVWDRARKIDWVFNKQPG